MITIGYSTRQSNPELQEYLKKSCGHPKVQVIEKVNPNGRSLTEVYNEILNESEHDIVVLCHDDIYFENKNWSNKLLNHFKRSDYGILGVAGSTILPKSGMWWEDRSKMIGIVNHESNGKKWESKYSNSLGNQIQNVVLVDGLFIAIHKERIKENFDEEVKGFHLYDVDFSFRNYINDVKIGVIYDIRITHKSIGATNEQWEENRKIFSEKYSEKLPIKILKTDKDKLKILMACLNFKTFTGSEVYVYELAKSLVKKGHDVTVVSEIGGPLTELAKKVGIKVMSLQEPPGYKLGDGKWVLNTPQGPQVSIPNTMYKISDVKYDLIHVQHTPISKFMCDLYPQIEKISTIHSEVIDLEHPYIHESIKHYICIRPQIQNYVVDTFEIPKEKTSVIYNPVDENRFKPTNIPEKNAALFVGTIDYLRENTIRDLIEQTRNEGIEFWLLGQNKSDYLDEILQNGHVKHFNPVWNTEKYIQQVKYTAGVLLGRTTIESWMCGKPAYIYNVDSNGHVNGKTIIDPPFGEGIDKYKLSNVTNKINEKYLEIING